MYPVFFHAHLVSFSRSLLSMQLFLRTLISKGGWFEHMLITFTAICTHHSNLFDIRINWARFIPINWARCCYCSSLHNWFRVKRSIQCCAIVIFKRLSVCLFSLLCLFSLNFISNIFFLQTNGFLQDVLREKRLKNWRIVRLKTERNQQQWCKDKENHFILCTK